MPLMRVPEFKPSYPIKSTMKTFLLSPYSLGNLGKLFSKDIPQALRHAWQIKSDYPAFLDETYNRWGHHSWDILQRGNKYYIRYCDGGTKTKPLSEKSFQEADIQYAEVVDKQHKHRFFSSFLSAKHHSVAKPIVAIKKFTR